MVDDKTDDLTSTRAFHLQSQQMLKFCLVSKARTLLILFMSSG